MERFDDFPEALVNPRLTFRNEDQAGLDLRPGFTGPKPLKRGPMRVEVLETNPKAPLAPELLEALLKVAAWQVCPPVLKGKRTAWVQPTEPVGRIQGISIKGVGLNKDGEVHPPLAVEYHGVVDKLGFDKEGYPYLIDELREPIGGFSLPAAKQEWIATLRANDHDVHATTPLALAQYPDMKWEGQPMGVLMLGSPNAYDMRLRNLIDLGVNHPFLEACLDKDETLGEFLGRVYYSIGLDTAKLHHKQRGHRLQPHSGNFSFDFEKRRTIFNDLEQVDPFIEEETPIQGLYMLEDIHFILTRLRENILSHGIMKKTLKDDEVKNIVIAFLCGYFGNEYYEKASRFADEFAGGMDTIILRMFSRPESYVDEKVWLFELFKHSRYGKTYRPPYEKHEYRGVQEEVIRQRRLRDSLMSGL